MRAFLRYFREHPWQRRAVTLSVAGILGVLAAWVALPIVRRHEILRMLGSEDFARRREGIERATPYALRHPELIEVLEDHLDASDDRRFSAMMEVLGRLGRYDSPRRTGEQKDRYLAISFHASRQTSPRLTWLFRTVLGGRDNAHVRRTLAGALADESVQVRGESAVLAVRLADDQALLTLLGDGDPTVRARAAEAAGLAKRNACADAIGALLSDDRTDAEIASAAFALARLDPRRHARAIVSAADRALSAGRDELVEKLLVVAAELPPETAGPFVRKVLAGNGLPPASAFVAARKLKLPEALPAAQAAIDRLIAGKEGMTVGQAMVLAAAVRAADELGAPVAVYRRVMSELWHPGPGVSLAMVFAAEALGRREETLKDPESLSLLSAAAEDGRAPLAAASAAAAVALDRLEPGSERTSGALWAVCGSEAYLAGDYVAWHLGRSPQRRRAGEVAAELLAPGVFDKEVRSVGALLLAMVYRDTDKASTAERIIRARLQPRTRAGEIDPFAAGTYQCALMILGADDVEQDVIRLSRADLFPKRRALTALMLRGHPAGLDRMLADKLPDPERIDSYLSGRLIARVVRALRPDLAGVDLDAPVSVRYWQCRLLRDDYLIHRSSLTAPPAPATSPG